MRIKMVTLALCFGSLADYSRNKDVLVEAESFSGIGGKTEWCGLPGEVILTRQDIVEGVSCPDACVTTNWTIGLHYPKKAVIHGS